MIWLLVGLRASCLNRLRMSGKKWHSRVGTNMGDMCICAESMPWKYVGCPLCFCRGHQTSVIICEEDRVNILHIGTSLHLLCIMCPVALAGALGELMERHPRAAKYLSREESAPQELLGSLEVQTQTHLLPELILSCYHAWSAQSVLACARRGLPARKPYAGGLR